MKKYILPVLIAIACLGLQQARADFIDYSLSTGNDPGLGTGPFGTVDINLISGNTALFTFTAAAGYLFVDGGANAINVNTTDNGWTVTNIVSNGNPLSPDGAGNEDGFGNFNQKISQQNSSNGASLVTFTLTNTAGTWASASQVLIDNENGWEVGAHILRLNANGLTGFAVGNELSVIPHGGGVPDGGTTVMLLGTALGALSMARRYLKR
jgi:hypothetical protein